MRDSDVGEPSAGFADASSGFTRQQTPIGQQLIAAGHISEQDLSDCLKRQKASGLRLGEELIGLGKIRPVDFYRVLALQSGLPFVNLISDEPDGSLLLDKDLDLYLKARALPWRHIKGSLIFASVDPRQARPLLAQHVAEPFLIYQTSSFDILWATQKHYAATLSARACNHLHNVAPHASAKTLLEARPFWILMFFLCVLIAATVLAPTQVFLTANFAAAIAFLSLAGLRLAAIRGLRRRHADGKDDMQAPDRTRWPTYSILVPMLREADVLPILVDALQQLDYPGIRYQTHQKHPVCKHPQKITSPS